jgi:hypothetical protein
MYLTSKTYSSSGSWTAPAGVTSIVIQPYWTGGGSSGNQFGTSYIKAVVPQTSYSFGIDNSLDAFSFGSDFIYKLETNSSTSTLMFLTISWMD